MGSVLFLERPSACTTKTMTEACAALKPLTNMYFLPSYPNPHE